MLRNTHLKTVDRRRQPAVSQDRPFESVGIVA